MKPRNGGPDARCSQHGAHRYVYEITSAGTGAEASFTASAHADLDCDGVRSTFRIFVQPPPASPQAFEASCAPGGAPPRISPGLYSERPHE